MTYFCRKHSLFSFLFLVSFAVLGDSIDINMESPECVLPMGFGWEVGAAVLPPPPAPQTQPFPNSVVADSKTAAASASLLGVFLLSPTAVTQGARAALA